MKDSAASVHRMVSTSGLHSHQGPIMLWLSASDNRISFLQEWEMKTGQCLHLVAQGAKTSVFHISKGGLLLFSSRINWRGVREDFLIFGCKKSSFVIFLWTFGHNSRIKTRLQTVDVARTDVDRRVRLINNNNNETLAISVFILVYFSKNKKKGVQSDCQIKQNIVGGAQVWK